MTAPPRRASGRGAAGRGAPARGARERPKGKRGWAGCDAACPVEATLDVIGGRWKALALYHLLDGPQRFGALARLLPGVTARMLTLQLRELERDGVVHREVYREVPPKVEYSLTARGRTLAPLLIAMRDWGLAYTTAAPPAPAAPAAAAGARP